MGVVLIVTTIPNFSQHIVIILIANLIKEVVSMKIKRLSSFIKPGELLKWFLTAHFLFFIFFVSIAWAVEVDIYQTMEFGNDGELLTPSIMEDSTLGGITLVADPEWTITNSLWVADDYVRGFPGTITVNGTDYSGQGYHGWRWRNRFEGNYAVILYGTERQWNHPPYHDRITVGMFFTTTQTNRVSSQHDNIVMGGPDGTGQNWGSFCVLQTGDGGSGSNPPHLQAHSNNLPSSQGTTISPGKIDIEAGKTYWVNLHYDGPAGECKVAAFDPDNNWVQVGETVVAEAIPGSSMNSKIRVGRTDAHGDSPDNDTQTYISHLMVDFTNAAFPLLPDGAGTPDSEAPSIPGDLSADAISSSRIDLNWTASTDNMGVSGYRIYRDGAQVGTSATNSYSDPGLSANTQYSYTIAAYDAAGNTSNQCAPVNATTSAGSAEAKIFYVDAAIGNDSYDGLSLQTAWKTITKANSTLEAGDIVLIRGGTYSGTYINPANSGTSDSARITYSNFNNETVTITGSGYGIYLYKKSYITVNGIDFYSLNRWFRIYAGHYNIISFCDFDTRSSGSGDWTGALIADDFNDNTAASENSTYNWIHHCSFHRWAYGSYDAHDGSLFAIGSTATDPLDESGYNLIEENVFAYGGHDTFSVYSKYNVIRNNYMHNETNATNWDFDGFRSAIMEGPYAGSCLFEGNRFGPAGASGLSIRSSNNILRFNYFYNSDKGVQHVTDEVASHGRADDNRIYNNTFFNMGYGAGVPTSESGGIYFADWGRGDPTGNVLKNNIFYQNAGGAVTYSGVSDLQTVVNNWDNNIDPEFIDQSGNDPDNPNLPNLRLKSTSDAINAGVALTTITSPSGAGNQFTVEDAGYFMDGWAMASLGVQGDEIQLLGTTQRARITSVNYGTNTITINAPLNWSQGQGISLAYEGSLPDIGAYEYAGESDNELPSVPSDLSGTAVSQTTIDLTWTASTDNVGVAGYLIYRDGVQVATSATNGYSDTGLAAGTTYSYTVSAYDAAGNASAQCGAVNVATSSASSCLNDYDHDGDVDGRDLAEFLSIAGAGPADLIDFGEEFGRSDCLQP
jgi:chitodextrinase